MDLDTETLGARDLYEWMTTTILPRPIAWVSTVSPEGRTNLAPFSFFQGVCARPPTLLFCPVNDRHGQPKDTLRNVEATGEFVVNLVPFALVELMNATAATLPYGESEFERFQVRPAASLRVRPPRVADAPVAFECRLDRVIRLGEGPIAGHVVLGRIVHFHVQDAVLAPDGKPDPAKLDLVGRAGRNDYVRLGELFRLDRPR
ncbi:MAG: flavin reductase family protein [Verrucomicrobiales bacterium]|nr:flavin reductase family protein [Verrucomicrobiales bacterium]